MMSIQALLQVTCWVPSDVEIQILAIHDPLDDVLLKEDDTSTLTIVELVEDVAGRVPATVGDPDPEILRRSPSAENDPLVVSSIIQKFAVLVGVRPHEASVGSIEKEPTDLFVTESNFVDTTPENIGI